MKYIFLILVFTSTIAFSQENTGHFSKHVSDAYTINTKRLPLYSRLSQGRSEIISRKLLNMEALLLPLAKYLDKKAKVYQEAGIPVLQIELMPMDLPPLKEKQAIRYPFFFPLKIDQLNEKLNQAVEEEDFNALSEIADDYLQKLEAEQGTHCLVRHFLESIRRSANYAPYHIEEARELGLESPKKIIKQFIQLHLMGMKKAEAIDGLAFPLQAKGLPILCQDVPEIPAW